MFQQFAPTALTAVQWWVGRAGGPSLAAAFSVDMINEWGVDITNDGGRKLGPEMVITTEVIPVIESEYNTAIDAMNLTACGKLYHFFEWRDWEL